MAAMDPDVSFGASPNAFDYSQLNDEQLRSAIRFAEKHLCWVEEDHTTLLRAYREEIDAMRRHLIDRMLRRIVTGSAPLSDEQRERLKSRLRAACYGCKRDYQGRPRNVERPRGPRRRVDRDRSDGVTSALRPTNVNSWVLAGLAGDRGRLLRMSYNDELDWLRDRGVQIDHKGRIIVRLPEIPDEVDFDVVEREPSIAELMRHEINPRRDGSRGRRRRHLSTPVQRNPGATRFYRQLAAGARVGRPTIGSEVRVHVQTMIAQATRDILVKAPRHARRRL